MPLPRKKEEERENHDRWLVSYADFITLLFAFFTVLYAISQTDKAKYQKAVENIQRSFLSAGGIFPLRGTPFVPFEKPPGLGSQTPPAANESGSFSKGESTAERITEQLRGLFEKTTGLGLPAADISVIRNETGYKIRLGEVILFKPGGERIKKEFVPFLYELSKRLSKLGVQIQIEGHSDTTPYSTKQTNWELSIQRAYNVVKFFVEGSDFPQENISLAGYGDTKPLAQNDTAEGRSKNRRVEISIITPDRDISELPW